MKRALLALRVLHYVLTPRNVLVIAGTMALEYVWLSLGMADVFACMAQATPQGPSLDLVGFVLLILGTIAAAAGVVLIAGEIPVIVACIVDGAIGLLRPPKEPS